MLMATLQSIPEFRAFGTSEEDPSLIAGDAENCYECLFPVAEERDQYGNIVKWLRTAHRDATADYVELLVSMQHDGFCVGVAYLSAFRPLGWWFCNYFGVLTGFRSGDRALKFWAFVGEKCEKIMPAARGIVFETERFQDKDIESVLERLGSRSSGNLSPLTSAEEYSVTAAERIAGYLNYGFARRACGALLMISEDGNARRPFDYIQPALKLPLDETNEVPFGLWSCL
jgi:hypothetical protein